MASTYHLAFKWLKASLKPEMDTQLREERGGEEREERGGEGATYRLLHWHDS